MADDQMDPQRDDDGLHDFRSATFDANNEGFVDDHGHEFTRGRVSERDEDEER